MSLQRAFLTGLTLSLTNPKIVIFFSSIFVALIPLHAPTSVRIAAVGIVAIQEIAWCALVARLFSQPRIQTAYGRIQGGVERLMGAVFVSFGARILIGVKI